MPIKHLRKKYKLLAQRLVKLLDEHSLILCEEHLGDGEQPWVRNSETDSRYRRLSNQMDLVSSEMDLVYKEMYPNGNPDVRDKTGEQHLTNQQTVC